MPRTDRPKHQSTRHMQAIAGIAFLCLVSSICSAAEPQLRVYAELNAVDSVAVTSNEVTRIEGYASDLVRALLSEVGYSADIRIVPWPRLMISLESEPNVLGFNMTRTPDREDQFHWIGEIRPVNFQLWGLRERADELPRTLDEARDLRVSAYRNDVVEQYLLNKGFTNLVYVSDSSDVWNMLRRQRIDFIPYIQSGIEEFMSRLDSVKDELAPIIALDEISTAHYLVMSKDSDPELVELLQTTFQSMIDSGHHKELLRPTFQQ